MPNEIALWKQGDCYRLIDGYGNPYTVERLFRIFLQVLSEEGEGEIPRKWTPEEVARVLEPYRKPLE